MSRPLLLLVGVLALVAHVYADCSFNGHDFSSLMGTDIQGNDGTQTYDYYVSVCGALSSPAAASCNQVNPASSACQIQMLPTPNSQTFDIGDWLADKPATWAYADASGQKIMYTISGAAQCWAQGGSAAPYIANVIFSCGDNNGPLVITSAPQSCTKNFTYTTPLACSGSGPDHNGGGGGKKGLSGGWVFVIIVLVVSFVYVVAGCVYKSQKLGATGLDKCPNVEFWRDLPGLVKDGVSFTIAKCKSLCGGSATQGGNTYESM